MIQKKARPGCAPTPRVAKQLVLSGTTTSVPPTVRPLVLITRGRAEYMGRCPGCGHAHHHVSLGLKHAPCGAVYLLKPRRRGRAS